VQREQAPAVGLTTMRDFRVQPGAGPPTLLLGYGRIPQHAIPAAVRELAEAAPGSRTPARDGMTRPAP
jgi:hypothetical protein